MVSTEFVPAKRAYAPISVLTPEQEEEAHKRSLQLLETVGLKFLSPETWPILEAAAKLRKERAAMKLVTGDEAGDCKQQ